MSFQRHPSFQVWGPALGIVLLWILSFRCSCKVSGDFVGLVLSPLSPFRPCLHPHSPWGLPLRFSASLSLWAKAHTPRETCFSLQPPVTLSLSLEYSHIRIWHLHHSGAQAGNLGGCHTQCFFPPSLPAPHPQSIHKSC